MMTFHDRSILSFQHHCRKMMGAAHSIHVLAPAKIKNNVFVNVHMCEINK